MQLCPCGLSQPFAECCSVFINNSQFAATPEQLMRSRYTAYTLANVAYIARTMKAPAADNFDATSARQWAQQVKWLKLDVIRAYQEGNVGYVEFKAHYFYQHKKFLLHELSEFHQEHGQWFYVDGKVYA